MSNNPERILSVEDDPLQAEWIRTTIEKSLPGVQVRQMSTEHEFVSRFDEIASEPPKLILLDAMLRWTDPAPEMPPRPPDVKEGGIVNAGLRCKQKLAADARTIAIPVILYTVLRDNLAIPPNVWHVQKNADPYELIGKIKQALRQERRR